MRIGQSELCLREVLFRLSAAEWEWRHCRYSEVLSHLGQVMAYTRSLQEKSHSQAALKRIERILKIGKSKSVKAKLPKLQALVDLSSSEDLKKRMKRLARAASKQSAEFEIELDFFKHQVRFLQNGDLFYRLEKKLEKLVQHFTKTGTLKEVDLHKLYQEIGDVLQSIRQSG